MVKCQTVKLEFTPNVQKSFESSIKMYGYYIECAGKAAGKIYDDYFSAKYTFNIDSRTAKICSIHFIDVTHVVKNDTTHFASNQHYYDTSGYNVSNIGNISNSSSSYSNIIDDTFEQKVYNALHHIFSTGIVTQLGTTLNISLTNTTEDTIINYLVLHIKVGAQSYGSSSSVCNENSISDAIEKSCGKLKPSSHKKSTSTSSTASITTSESSKSSKISKSKRSHKKYKKSVPQNILKLIAWSSIVSFIIYIFKSKINED